LKSVAVDKHSASPGRGYDGGMNHFSLGPAVAAAISTLTAVAMSTLAVFVSRKAAWMGGDKKAFYEKQSDYGASEKA
jgi:hypothetical protein